MKHIIGIGADIGYLASTMRLNHQGFRMIVQVKLDKPGGCSNIIEEDGFRVDIGQMIPKIKETFENTCRAIGKDLNRQRITPQFVALLESRSSALSAIISRLAWRSHRCRQAAGR
jgi:phytoene dehydrogenase-like protein